jgi:hypothetical protein
MVRGWSPQILFQSPQVSAACRIFGDSCRTAAPTYPPDTSTDRPTIARWWAEVVRGVSRWQCFDATPTYACLPHVPARAAALTPSAKVVFMVGRPTWCLLGCRPVANATCLSWAGGGADTGAWKAGQNRGGQQHHRRQQLTALVDVMGRRAHAYSGHARTLLCRCANRCTLVFASPPAQPRRLRRDPWRSCSHPRPSSPPLARCASRPLQFSVRRTCCAAWVCPSAGPSPCPSPVAAAPARAARRPKLIWKQGRRQAGRALCCRCCGWGWARAHRLCPSR